MSTGFYLPTAWAQAKPMLEQYFQQLQAVVPIGPAQAPYPPTNLIAQPGTGQVILSWNPPQINAGVAGYRVYKGNESQLFQSIGDPATTQISIPIPANGSIGLYVSSVNAYGQESNKMFVLGKSSTQQVVASGGVNGAVPIAPIPPPPRGGPSRL